MASLIYDSCIDDVANDLINFGSDAFYCMLVTSSYVANKSTHLKRSDVTNEVAAAGSYVAGGFVAAVVPVKDTVDSQENISLGAISIASATITARGAVYYKHRGGASSADNLVAYIDFGSDIISTNGTWALTASTLRIQN
jgi:hypothetical protein